MVMGIDVGTTSISVVVFDPENRLITENINIANDSALESTHPYQKTQDPHQILGLIQPIYDRLIKKYTIRKVGITGQMHGILYTNRSGISVSELYTWQDESIILPFQNGQSYREFVNAATGYSLVSGIAFGLLTHYYLLQNKMVPKDAVKLCTIGDYIAMRLCGNSEPVMHISNAEGLGLYDLKDKSFDIAAMEKLQIDPSILPRVEPGYTAVGETQGKITVGTAIGDNQASFLGSVQDMDKEVLLNLGTGGQISCYSKEIMTADCIETRPLVNDDYIVVSTSHCGGRAYAALERFFRMVLKMASQPAKPLYEVMEQSIENHMKRDGDLKVCTAFCGSRSNPLQRGEISNITLENFTPENLIYGFLEGIAYELYPIFQTFKKTHSFTCLTVSGNTIRRNKVFRKILEEIYGLPLKLTEFVEDTACGAAIFANRIE